MILTVLAFFAAGLSVSGGVRVSSSKNRFEAAVKRYDILTLDLDEARGRLDRVLGRIGEDVIPSVGSQKRRIGS